MQEFILWAMGSKMNDCLIRSRFVYQKQLFFLSFFLIVWFSLHSACITDQMTEFSKLYKTNNLSESFITFLKCRDCGKHAYIGCDIYFNQIKNRKYWSTFK